MKMLVVNRNSIVSILAIVLVSIPLFVVGCSETEDDIEDDTEPEVVVNSQPSIGAIPDQTVNNEVRCVVGLTLKSGESCSYVGGGSSFTFNVLEDGFGCIDDALCAGKSLQINRFSASKNPDGSWTINRLP